MRGLTRRCHRGTLQKVLPQFGPEFAPGWHFVDSTRVKVHADGSNPAGGQASQAMGRTIMFALHSTHSTVALRFRSVHSILTTIGIPSKIPSMQIGEVLVVWKLDRHSRSLRSVTDLAES